MVLQYKIMSPGVVAPEHEPMMLVLPNEQAAGLEDHHGALAQYIANTLGMRVLAFERPYSADRAVFDLGARRHVTTEYPAVVSDTAAKLDKMMDQEGVDKVVTAGHSAAGLFALAMTATEQLPVTSTFATDPPAIRYSLPGSPLFTYGRYQLFTERRKPDDGLAQNKAIEKNLLIRNVIRRHAAEIFDYSAVYRSTVGFQTLQRIAHEMPEIGVSVAFPEFTFVVKAHAIRTIATRARAWRTDPHGAPFDIDVYAGTYHSTFSNHRFFGTLLKRALEKSAN